MACAIVSAASWTISAMNPDRRELDDALYGRRTGSLMPQVCWSAVTEHVGWIVSNLMRCSNSYSAIHSKEGGGRHTRRAEWRLCPSVTRLLPVTLYIQSLQILLGGWGRGHPWPARHLSRIRRSRLVGRPAPRSRAATGTEEVGGGAGVRSR